MTDSDKTIATQGEQAHWLRPPARSGNHATKLDRSLFAGKAATTLREAIIEGGLAAGTPLVETQLSEWLSVSRGPVRNALQVLEAEGLVKTLPNGRMTVVGFGPEDVRDLLETRHLLESSAVRRGLGLESSIEPVREAFLAIANEDPTNERLIQRDIAFHSSLVALSGSRFLISAWQSLASVIESVIIVSKRRLAEQDPADYQRRIVESHRVILDAVEARDAEAVSNMLFDQFELTNSMFTDGHLRHLHG